jgi:hypothetical protein
MLRHSRRRPRCQSDPAAATQTADPFRALLAHATPTDISCVPAAAPASDPGLRSVEVGRPIELCYPLPAAMRPCQALLFVRDDTGEVTLLSHSALLAGDVWYQDEVVVPRRDALMNGGGPTGRLWFTAPGRNTLLLVCCRERWARFDKLSLFERTAVWGKIGPLKYFSVSSSDLDELRRMITVLPPDQWAVVSATIETIAATSGGRSLLLHEKVARAKLPARLAAPGERRGQPCPGKFAAMPDYPFDFIVPPEIKARLAHECGLVRSWASEQTEPMFDHAKWDAPIGRFGRRINTVWTRGLFVDPNVPRRPGQLLLDRINEMAGRIAYQVYDLHYDKDPVDPNRSRWRSADGTPACYDRRGRGYLNRMGQNNHGYPPPPSIIEQETLPAVDMALIAHCFQTPIAIWEARDDRLFDFWLERIQAGRPLFEYRDINYLLDLASSTNDLGYFEVSVARRAESEVIELPMLPAGQNLGFKMPLPGDFNAAEALLFEYDRGADTLTVQSTFAQTGGNLLFTAEVVTPRPGATGRGVRFSPSLQSDLLLLLVSPGALDPRYHRVSSLSSLDFYAQGGQTALSGSQIADLRRLVFRLPTSHRRLFKKTVQIGGR